MELKLCPCGEKVLSLITDLATGSKVCFHCDPDQTSNEVRVARKMHEIYMSTGSLDSYPISERLANLAGYW